MAGFFAPVLFLTLIIGFFAICGLVDHLSYREQLKIINPRNLPEGWVQVKGLLVWEKSSDKGIYQVVKKRDHYLILANGQAVQRIDGEATLVALFEADQLIRF